MVGGANMAPSKMLLKVLCAGSQGSVSVPGILAKLGLFDAAYYGAQTANVMDFDDDLIGHPGATISPVALAVGQVTRAKGRDLLAAIVAGYEVSVRVGEAGMPTYERAQAVNGFSCWQTFGSVVTAGRLLSLSNTQMEHAMGLAGAQAPVPNLRKQFGRGIVSGWLKHGYGISAKIGALSAQLAADGFEGHRSILDGESGFWIMSGSDRFRPELALSGLGAAWKIDDVNFKAYACCYWLQTLLDAVDILRLQKGIADVESIEIHSFEGLGRKFCGPMPTSVFEAQFQAIYVAALQWLGRSPAQGLKEEDLNDPAVLAVARKISVRHDPTMDQGFRERALYPVRVALTDTSGAISEARLDTPRAASNDAPTEELVKNKFFSILEARLGKQPTVDAWNMIRNVENHDTDELVPLLVPTASDQIYAN